MNNLYVKPSKHEIENMLTDIIKISSILVIIHLLSYSIENEGDLFDEKTLKYIVYIVIAFIIYHFIIKRIVLQNIFKKKRK